MSENYCNDVALAALPGVSPATLMAIRAEGWDGDTLLCATDATLKAIGLRPAARKAIAQWQLQQGPLRERVCQVTAWQQSDPALNHVVGWQDARYPLLLREIPDPPPFLQVRGDPEVLNLPQLGMVGSRHATRQGLRHAADFAAALTEAGFVVTSGMALGIDGAAHRAATERQAPTVAVMGTGPDILYPARHRTLAAQIVAAGGALVSEFWPGAPPLGGHFPRRNRIISGLSAGVLVVEAAPRSGSLITARLALEYDREVFAIPGPLHSPQSQGCHELIRQGATLVQETAHIVEQLSSLLGVQARTAPATGADRRGPAVELAPDEQALLALMEADQLSLDQLCQLSGQSVAELSRLLTGLELKGLVESSGIGYQRVC